MNNNPQNHLSDWLRTDDARTAEINWDDDANAFVVWLSVLPLLPIAIGQGATIEEATADAFEKWAEVEPKVNRLLHEYNEGRVDA